MRRWNRGIQCIKQEFILRKKFLLAICLFISLLLVAYFFNREYEVISFHLLRSDGRSEIKVMTWNVHCSKGADSIKQRKIAELVLDVDADFVLLNEYYQDSCSVTDSLLRMRYPFTEESRSHRRCGDIFYSKIMMFHTGRVKTPKKVKRTQTIKATITVGNDSVQVFGVHMASNRYDGTSFEKVLDGDSTSYDQYKDAQLKRCFQTHWIKEAVLDSKLPVIVMGDMNDFNYSAPLDTLMSCGLMDAWWEGGNGYGATFHSGWMRLRIDHILHSKELKLESIKVIETNLSDHNPVVAEFSLNTNTNHTN